MYTDRNKYFCHIEKEQMNEFIYKKDKIKQTKFFKNIKALMLIRAFILLIILCFNGMYMYV